MRKLSAVTTKLLLLINIILLVIVLKLPSQPEIVVETKTEIKPVLVKEYSPLSLEELGTYSVTAYCSSDPGCNLVTSNGARVEEGVTIAASKEIPFGTKLYIEGVGVRVVQDRGGGIGPGHLDLYFSNYQDAENFGRQHLKVWRIVE